MTFCPPGLWLAYCRRPDVEDRVLGTVLSLALAAVSVGVSVYFGRYSARQMAERISLRWFLRVRQTLSRSGLDISRVARQQP